MDMKKGMRSLDCAGLATWRGQASWKSLFVVVLFLVLATTTFMLDEIFQAARSHSVHLVEGLPNAASAISSEFPERVVEDSSVLLLDEEHNIFELLSELEPDNSGLTTVRDIVAFPDEVMLLVEAASGSVAPSKDDLVCLFGNHHETGVFTVEWKDEHHSILAVRCEHPHQEILLESSKEATLLFKGTNYAIPSSVQYTTNSSWTPLVYETVTETDSVILFVKGLLTRNGRPANYSGSLHKLHCRFGDHVKSPVRVIAQEVVRCELPAEDAMQHLDGTRVSLFVPKMGLLPSVAYFSSLPERSVPASGDRQFHVCACSMVWNQAPFLREWIMYHAFLGVERWYLYDNNSDDDTEEVLGGLQSAAYNVSRHPWPWIKTQEAGFSHCAVRARADCDWLLFADVDEFVYPVKGLLEFVYGSSSPEAKKNGKALARAWVESKTPVNWRNVAARAFAPNGTSVLRRLINKTVDKGKAAGKTVGEVRLDCHNFGPSNLTRAPEEGVIMGYTCRMRLPKRHKSFVFLDAMSDSLMNVVHHFALKAGYRQIAIHPQVAVINHYKFQAWEVFKAKFVRRVATYVVDWREQTAQSNDRAPGLGLDAVEPEDWASRYCDEVDWGLKSFTEKAFRDPQTEFLPWAIPVNESRSEYR